MIYLDNAATSFPKPKCVVDELYRCVCDYCGNPGRSSHPLSLASSEAIYTARERIGELFSIDTPERVVFTYNATYALNLAIKTTITSKCHVIISDIEHNAVLRPIERLKETLGVEYSLFSANNPCESIKSLIRADTTAIISTLASNVTGITVDLSVLSDIAQEYGLHLIIDASQAAGHFEIDLSDKCFTALCAPGHKGLYGIQGSGFAVFSSSERSNSFIEGGSGTDSISRVMPRFLPDGYEAGTPSTPAIATLSAGIEFINSVGINEISNRLNQLSFLLQERLRELEGIVLYESDNGIVSFNVKDIPSSMISQRLDKHGICTRSGLHCAPLAHERLGTKKSGTVRVSFSYFNTERDIDVFCNILKSELSQI